MDPIPNEIPEVEARLLGMQRAIWRLTLSVWVLALLVAANCVVLVKPLMVKTTLNQLLSGKAPASPPLPLPVPARSAYAYEGFHSWPLQRKVEAASMILVGRWEEARGNLNCIITEVLKQDPKIKYGYKVGDLYDSGIGTEGMRKHRKEGDYQLFYFTGVPPNFTYSVSGGSTTPSGNSLDAIREAVKRLEGEPAPK